LRIAFRPEEVFAVACQLERAGAEFYRRAAEAAGDPGTARLLLELAAMEDEHLATFEDVIRAKWGGARERAAFDADVALQYLRAVSSGHVVDFSPDLEKRLADCEGPEAILRVAIGIEKDSVVLYAGIEAMAVGRPGWPAAHRILLEELRHILKLSGRLEALA
jgi:rubrerythrin